MDKISKIKRTLGSLKISRHYIPIFALEQVYKSLIRPVIEYCDIIYSHCVYDRNNDKLSPLSLSTISLKGKLEIIQYQGFSTTGT